MGWTSNNCLEMVVDWPIIDMIWRPRCSGVDWNGRPKVTFQRKKFDVTRFFDYLCKQKEAPVKLKTKKNCITVYCGLFLVVKGLGSGCIDLLVNFL